MFITYTHVDQIRSRAKKWQVQSFQNLRRHEVKATAPATLPAADKSVRTRKPPVLLGKSASRTLAPSRGGKLAENLSRSTSENNFENDNWVLVVEDDDPLRTAIGSLRREPFESWPMESNGRVQLTVDYCEPYPATPVSRLQFDIETLQSRRYMLP